MTNSFVSLELFEVLTHHNRYLALSTKQKFRRSPLNEFFFPHTQTMHGWLTFSLLTFRWYADDWIDIAFGECFPPGFRFISFFLCAASRFVAHSSSASRFAHNKFIALVLCTQSRHSHLIFQTIKTLERVTGTTIFFVSNALASL